MSSGSRVLAASVATGVMLLGPMATASASGAGHGHEHSQSRALSRAHRPASGGGKRSGHGGIKHDSKRQHAQHQHASKREHAKHQHDTKRHGEQAHHAPGVRTPATHRPATATAAGRAIASASAARAASAVEVRLNASSLRVQPAPSSVHYVGVVAVPAPVARPAAAHRAPHPTMRRDVRLLANRFEQAPLPGKIVVVLAGALAMVMIFAGGSIGRRRRA